MSCNAGVGEKHFFRRCLNSGSAYAFFFRNYHMVCVLGTALGDAIEPYMGKQNMLQREDVLEEYASVLRPLLR